MWVAVTVLFLLIFAGDILLGLYLDETPLGTIHLGHARVSGLIANLLGIWLILYVFSAAVRKVARRYPPGDPAAARAVRRTRLSLVFAVLFFVASVFMIAMLFSGPREFGICCARGVARDGNAIAACQVVQTNVVGPKSAFWIREDNIGGARTVCGGGDERKGSACKVDLQLRSGPYNSYPVLSYGGFDQADASTHQLNEYFKDPSRTSIALEHDGRVALLLLGCGPMVIVVMLALAALLWSRRHRGQEG